jgi:hypothetical protein
MSEPVFLITTRYPPETAAMLRQLAGNIIPKRRYPAPRRSS